MPDDHVIVKLDFSNAFYNSHRDAMLKAVADRVSSIYKFYHLPYSQPSILKFNNHRIISEEGPQQGDPIGSLLVCNTIYPLLSQMKADLVEVYMDDITLGGTRNDVATDVIKIRCEGGELGLQLNAKKCELIQHSSTSAEPAFQDFVIMTPDKASLLGAPLTEGPSLNNALYARCGELSRAIGRLCNAHAPLFPCFGNEALEQFDSLLRSSRCTITNFAVFNTQ